MITAIIRNKENTLVLELPHSIYDIYEKLQSIGIMQPPKRIPLTDNEDEDIGVKLFSESDFGQHLLLTLNEKNTIADANMLTLVIGAASEDIKEELEQNILYDQYDSMDEVINAVRQMTQDAGPVKAVFFCPLVGNIDEGDGDMFTVGDSYLADSADEIVDAWQILNSKDFGVPQSRKRVYIVGYLRERCAGEILSFTNANTASLIQLLGGTEGNRVYSDEGVGITLTSNAGGFGGKTGLYDVALPIKVDTKSGFQLAHPGDSIDLAYPTMNTRRGRVGEKIAHTVTPGNTQGYFFIDMNADPQLTETARCITARQDSGISKHKGEHSAVFIEDEPRAVVTPDKKTIRQQGRWIKEPNEPMFTLTVQDRHGILRYGRVRKLTPRECWRLQGFTDEQFDKAKAAGLSDGRLYKMAGNAVSVPVVSAVGAVIKRIYQEQIQKG